MTRRVFEFLGHRQYLLGLLAVILALTYIDRMVLGVVQQDIKLDLHLSDTQLGMLGGIAFTLFYGLAGIPIARWADRGRRVGVVAVTTAVWTVGVACCAFAQSFPQLLLTRMGIAAGESGCAPIANSLIPDCFTRDERPRATARYWLGVPIGLILGYLIGGWFDQRYGWRATFLILGVPGAVAALAALALKEPRRRLRHTALEAPPSLAMVMPVLWGSATLRNLLACFLLWYFCGWAIVQWQPTFFIRSHNVSLAQLGIFLALGQGVARLLGTWLGGELATRYAGNNERLQLLGAGALFLGLGVFSAIGLLVSSQCIALCAVALGAVAEGAVYAPVYATLQTLIQPRMRATATALIVLVPSFVGNGLGPVAAGLVSDALHRSMGEESLRYALLLFCPGYLWAAWHLWRAADTLRPI